ncbi:MAG: hypothetical protein J6386_00195 [Candidatus Synoicihabitans palmerolidicus]|nr:hypothetical protein [Candidatus Synoicihabitans palmerolidicus]
MISRYFRLIALAASASTSLALSPTLAMNNAAFSNGETTQAEEPMERVDPDAWLDQSAETMPDHYRTEGEWSLELVRPFTPVPNSIVEVSEMPPKPASQMMLRLKVHELDGTSTDVTVFVRAKVWRDAWIAREPLTRGGAIEPHLVEVRRVDILPQRDQVPVDTDVSDLFMSHPLPVGRFVSWRDVARRPLVRVRNTESRREFAAVVTAQGQAVVQFSSDEKTYSNYCYIVVGALGDEGGRGVIVEPPRRFGALHVCGPARGVGGRYSDDSNQ